MSGALLDAQCVRSDSNNRTAGSTYSRLFLSKRLLPILARQAYQELPRTPASVGLSAVARESGRLCAPDPLCSFEPPWDISVHA